ncbi:MAG: DUF3501 family protein [Pseudomonadota bacterium]|nr:DUF3501 family protein [Pseudomonadota bacterium]MED5392419.1 DUF3501 family protein [Pseudomonadota bacterium]MEE3282684.1 DUF3501 family protein [Pseudomonadota bacterium]
MDKLIPASLMTLEKYANDREDFRARIMAHKNKRRVAIGPNVTLYFEDALTMQYQIQEMLRLERIFEAEKIQEELDAYNPLIPDGSNLKATMMIEFPDVEERRAELQRLIGIETALWLTVGDLSRVTPIANEDLDRETADKTSAVHFVRFELTEQMIGSFRAGEKLLIGIDHPAYVYATPVSTSTHAALVRDLHG